MSEEDSGDWRLAMEVIPGAGRGTGCKKQERRPAPCSNLDCNAVGRIPGELSNSIEFN